jgi:hypothetical protein
MSGRYSLRTRTTVTTTTAACYELIGSTTRRTRLVEMHLFNGAATQSLYGLGIPAAIGVTPTSPVNLIAEDSGDPALGSTDEKTAVAWGTGPTVPANFFRIWNSPAAIGAAILWTFGPNGIVIPTSKSLVLWNLQANSAVLDVVAVCEI